MTRGSCSGSARGSHIHVAVEAFATGIKNLDRWKSTLIAWSLRSEALDSLILREFKGQNVATPAMYLRKCVDRLILVAQNLAWSLDRLLKRTFITWFHFDPSCKRFYRRCICDYPLHVQLRGTDYSSTSRYGCRSVIIVVIIGSTTTILCYSSLKLNFIPLHTAISISCTIWTRGGH